MKNIRKILKTLLIVTILFLGLTVRVHASGINVNLTIRDENTIVFSGSVTSLETTSLNDNEGNPHIIDPNSVLAILNDADQSDNTWSISNLAYFSSFNSLYLKCITDQSGEKCDKWQYVVNDLYPPSGMDQNILSGGENIYIYFGSQNRVLLNSNSINTDDTLTVTAQKYDYQNNTWVLRTGITVGLTQPDPNNTFSPIEVKTNTVDTNGQATFSLIPAGSYNVGIKEDFYFPTETLTVIIPPVVVSSGSGLSYTPPPVIKTKFDLKKAFDFIISQQKEDGSFGEDLYTDWSTISITSLESQNQKIQSIIKLVKYLGELKPSGTLLTDFERRAMALMSLGLNPYNTNNENYIKKITDSFDGKQFGNVNEDNDDIFALIPLSNAGFTSNDVMITDAIKFILSRQKENGSWDESVDMTAGGIQALVLFDQNDLIKNALIKAKEFLKQNQKDTGGWNNVSSTAWAIEGILALSEKPEDWVKNGNTPLDYLGINQDSDGGIKDENIQNKIWETAYTLSALSGKTWNQTMQKFEKPKEEISEKKEESKIASGNKNIERKIVLKKYSKNIRISKNLNNENESQQLKNLASQNTANVINSLEVSNTNSVKKNWFIRFLEFIFN